MDVADLLHRRLQLVGNDFRGFSFFQLLADLLDQHLVSSLHAALLQTLSQAIFPGLLFPHFPGVFQIKLRVQHIPHLRTMPLNKFCQDPLSHAGLHGPPVINGGPQGHVLVHG